VNGVDEGSGVKFRSTVSKVVECVVGKIWMENNTAVKCDGRSELQDETKGTTCEHSRILIVQTLISFSKGRKS